LKQILKNHPEINCLVSNAGYGDFGPLENFSILQINNFIATNLSSHLVITKLLLPHFKKKKHGDLIFMGSESGLLGAKNGSLYCAAKFGLRGFTQALSKDIANKNIRVSIINPGMVRTDFFENLKFEPGIDKQNVIRIEDISSTVVYILNLSSNTIVDEINLAPSKKVIKFK
jgi:3-hydroxy acid dehydrogenase/malonic semialdehyde reductase